MLYLKTKTLFTQIMTATFIAAFAFSVDAVASSSFKPVQDIASLNTYEAATGKNSGEAQTENYSYKSYREWKNSKITEIESRVKTLRERLVNNSANRYPSKDSTVSAKSNTEAGLNAELEDQLDQELLNLSVSRDLSISDYFVGYLIKQPSLERAIDEVSARLTAEEVAELMDAFARQFSQPKSNGTKTAPRADFTTK